MAAGLTVTAVELRCTRTVSARPPSPGRQRAPRDAAGLDIDAALVASGATAELMDLIERVSPFGQGNAEARFVLPAHRVKFGKIIGDAHVRVILEGGDGARLDAIAFRAAGQPLGDALDVGRRHAAARRRTPAARHLGRARPHRAAD